MNRFIFLLILLVPMISHAESYLKYGLGVFKSAQDSRAEVKTIALGYQEEWLGAIINQYEIGMYADSRSDLGRKSAGFASISLGLDVKADFIYTQALWGIAGLTHTDSMLGGHLQFNNDLGLGIRDKKGNAIGLNYKHMSSAGIFSPNQGRDLLMIKMGVPF